MPDIEVTDEMIEAGLRELIYTVHPNTKSYAEIVSAIYRAMRAKEREGIVSAYQSVTWTTEKSFMDEQVGRQATQPPPHPKGQEQ